MQWTVDDVTGAAAASTVTDVYWSLIKIGAVPNIYHTLAEFIGKHVWRLDSVSHFVFTCKRIKENLSPYRQ